MLSRIGREGFDNKDGAYADDLLSAGRCPSPANPPKPPIMPPPGGSSPAWLEDTGGNQLPKFLDPTVHITTTPAMAGRPFF
jgi:hypothetical protein